ncbi:AI-2E family transporter [Biomaibacter acetigenes]|uniref:AI-2E family transporter n=1 Tax=Biomaibacter acetigenes TaxID=2316383 RepID=A0A3G2RA45_9FIRM|nr:AI-2E family transporter [Biomaibacter acetigenes]RKL62966.1 AI-2E family transporter [Thermoanaerobacteraceae bacterium SP2]
MFSLFIIILILLFSQRKKIEAILLPFAIGLLISYILDPVVVFLSTKGIKRSIAVALIYFILIGSIIIALVYIIPVILMELNNLINTIPFYTREIQDIVKDFKMKYKATLPAGVQEVIDRNIAQIEKILLSILQNIANIIMGWVSSLFSIILGPVVGFYLLKDLDKIKINMVHFLPYNQKQQVISFLEKIDTTLGRYIRSQLIVSFIIGILTTLALYILRIDFALLIGLLAGITNIIPYFGPFIGALPAVIITMLRYPHKIVWLIIAIIIIHELESGVISPHIVGENVGLHPLTVIFSLLVGGTFFGLWGMILAVPVAALVKIMLVSRLKKS